MSIDSFVVTPCPRTRLDELRGLLAGLAHPRERVVVITTEPHTIDMDDIDDLAAHLVHDSLPGMSFSRWINYGLDRVADLREGYDPESPYEVLCIGSDAVGDHESVDVLAEAMRTYGLMMAGPDWRAPHSHHNREVSILEGDRNVHDRVPGACFMLAGEHQLRMDERFRWWYSDDDLEMQARLIGHVGLVRGTGLRHEQDHMLDADQARHATEDRELFKVKWGREPW